MSGAAVFAFLAVALVAFRLGRRAAWLAGYRDALADVEATDRHVGWVRTVSEPAPEDGATGRHAASQEAPQEDASRACSAEPARVLLAVIR